MAKKYSKENEFKTLDNQWSELPKEVIFCKNCVVSNQRPRTRFNEKGICSACEWALEKDRVIDWKKRESELKELCNKFKVTKQKNYFFFN